MMEIWNMDRKILYAFRGFIGFLAFIDLSQAARSYIERRTFLSDTNSMSAQILEENFTISRILGILFILKATNLIFTTLYIHYRPVVFLGIYSLVLFIYLYIQEALYFRSTTLNFYVIFPCVLNCITLFGLIYLPKRLRLWEPVLSNCDDENSQLLKQMGNFKKRRLQSKKN